MLLFLSRVNSVYGIFILDRQDSRSHSSRRSSPESDRQVHSRSGSFDSRDRLQERDRYEHERERERERRDTRQREWDRDADKDWSRNRDRDRLRERERERDKRRDLDRERERLISDSMERDRDRDRTFESCSQMESIKRSEAKLESEHERDLEGTSRDSITLDKERMDKDLASVQGFEDINKAERTESVEGGCHTFLSVILLHSFSDFTGNKHFLLKGNLLCVFTPLFFRESKFYKEKSYHILKCVPFISIVKADLVQISLNEIKDNLDVVSIDVENSHHFFFLDV